MRMSGAWRVYLGSEARAYEREAGCGIAAAAAVVAAASGVSRTTVMAGARASWRTGRGRCRGGCGGRAGAARGRRIADRGLGEALRRLLEAGTRGDPVVAVTWTTLSLRDLERELAALGFAVREGRDRADAARGRLQPAGDVAGGGGAAAPGPGRPVPPHQRLVAEFAAAGDPVVSVDGKKKEQLGPFTGRGGRGGRQGDPVRVRDHDFPDEELGKVTPYGVYDIAANRGFVSVGTSRDTAAFAVSALRLLVAGRGRAPLPGGAAAAGHLRCRRVERLPVPAWKDQLARLAAETGLEITVCHFPPGHERSGTRSSTGCSATSPGPGRRGP